MRKIIIIFLFVNTAVLNPVFADDVQKTIEYGYGLEAVWLLPFPYLEIGANIENTPLAIRQKISYVIKIAYESTEMSYKKLFNDKYDLFLAFNAVATIDLIGVGVQTGIDIPREKKGRFWRLGLAYEKLKYYNKYDYQFIPIAGVEYRF